MSSSFKNVSSQTNFEIKHVATNNSIYAASSKENAHVTYVFGRFIFTITIMNHVTFIHKHIARDQQILLRIYLSMFVMVSQTDLSPIQSSFILIVNKNFVKCNSCRWTFVKFGRKIRNAPKR